MAYRTGTIAKGCFGKVYKEKYNDTWAAIKKVPQHLINRKDLERECAVYNKCEHPNIVKLLGNITLTSGKWVIPLEFIFGEDLETTIFKAAKSKIQMSPANKGKIIVGMCEGLLYLHSKDVVHQDLKPENIMVEHSTNRAVIIDLGLAKFFKYGLNSAVDMGNEAYSAPEVLQRGIQRDQRSDVWAMGKIIAEFCARIRLHTPSVCPTKIRETLKDQPFCQAVCRMVEPDPTLRASMGGIIQDIRRAGRTALNTDVQKEHLQPPAPNIDVRNRSPSPMNRGTPPYNRDPSPSRFGRDLSPMNRGLSPHNRDPSPSPFRRDLSPMNRGLSPHNRDPSPSRFGRDPSPFRRDPSPMNRFLSPYNRDPSPMNRSPSPRNMEPRPEIKRPQFGQHLTPYPNKAGNNNRKQDQAPKSSSDLTKDFSKMQMYQEATKDLPINLPTTGRVVVRRFEEKDGDLETWEQKEVVTRDGKIVKFDDVKFRSK